jgi:hypothetical protein
MYGGLMYEKDKRRMEVPRKDRGASSYQDVREGQEAQAITKMYEQACADVGKMSPSVTTLMHVAHGMAEKVSTIELRSCADSTSNKNDVIRQSWAWMRGDSVTESSKQFEAYKDMALKNMNELSYGGLMYERDKRRMEVVVVMIYYRVAVEGWDQLIFEPCSEQVGWALQKCPTFLATMRKRMTDEEFAKTFGALGETPKGLQCMLDLVHPVNKEFEPVSQEELEVLLPPGIYLINYIYCYMYIIILYIYIYLIN